MRNPRFLLYIALVLAIINLIEKADQAPQLPLVHAAFARGGSLPELRRAECPSLHRAPASQEDRLMTGSIGTAIAGIGFRAIAGRAIGKAASGLKAGGKWVGSLDAIHLLALVLGVLLVVDHVALIMSHHHSAKVEDQLSKALAARDSARTSLATSQANEATLRIQVAKQNVAIAALGQASGQQQQAAQKARAAAAPRADAADASAAALHRSAAQKPLPGAPCEPSDILKRQWQ